MQNFVLGNHTKIIFGLGTIGQVGVGVAHLGRRVFLVCGRASCKQNGVHRQVLASLAEAGVTVVELGGVRANPPSRSGAGGD